MFDLWYFICRYPLSLLPKKVFNNIVRRIHFIRFGIKYYPRKQSGRNTFTSFLWELKSSLSGDIHQILVDKVQVKQFLLERSVPGLKIIPNYLVTADIRDIENLDLPKDFIVKANHGSGWNRVVYEKDEREMEINLRLFKKWLKFDAYYLNRELQYKGINRLLLVEQLIDREPNDYKFFCYCGKVKAIQVDSSRFTNHRRSLFDRNWNELDIKFRYEGVEDKVPPSNLDRMIEIAEKLAEEFIFVRIDLYSVREEIYFGEFTFCPGGGNEPFVDFKSDEDFLKLIIN